MEFVDYVMREALILVPVLMIIGKIIKNTPRVRNWMIPYILLVLGIILAGLIMGFSVESFIQGVLVTGAAVFGHQLFKQGKNYRDLKN
ncbi:putative membrane protein [Evansella vedderi]|uniref:Membrane protein n=1 Tax=Evansella vedderi TaxID=38282 RepID=A0ABU0A350_9BACI|nr:phage holin family protein [Evansella vedderi]MDQ0257917.1 putative membrane protein [Evansella vedderi]